MITQEMIIKTLSNWGYNEGEFEEIAAKLAENAEETMWNASVEICDDCISYSLILTIKGVEMYKEWCREFGFTPNLTGKNNTLEFVDENSDSVKNTLADWGITQNIKKFKNYLSIVWDYMDRIQQLKTLLVVKERNGKVDISAYSDANYADFSGATNKGTVLISRAFRQEVDRESMVKWNALLKDVERAEKFFTILAQENGVEAVLLDNKIYAIQNNELGRVIYAI